MVKALVSHIQGVNDERDNRFRMPVQTRLLILDEVGANDLDLTDE